MPANALKASERVPQEGSSSTTSSKRVDSESYGKKGEGLVFRPRSLIQINESKDRQLQLIHRERINPQALKIYQFANYRNPQVMKTPLSIWSAGRQEGRKYFIQLCIQKLRVETVHTTESRSQHVATCSC